MLGNIIGAFILIVIGVSLIPMVQQQVQQVQLNQTSNLTPTANTLLNILPLFFGLAIAMSVIGMSISALGFNSYSNHYKEENKDVPIKQRPHKQTYLEYVQERLAVEKLIHRG